MALISKMAVPVLEVEGVSEKREAFEEDHAPLWGDNSISGLSSTTFYFRFQIDIPFFF